MSTTVIISALVSVITVLSGVIRYLYKQLEKRDELIIKTAEGKSELLAHYFDLLALPQAKVNRDETTERNCPNCAGK